MSKVIIAKSKSVRDLEFIFFFASLFSYARSRTQVEVSDVAEASAASESSACVQDAQVFHHCKRSRLWNYSKRKGEIWDPNLEMERIGGSDQEKGRPEVGMSRAWVRRMLQKVPLSHL